jgi:hypothetical protein
LKKTFSIKQNPEQVKTILTSLTADYHFSKTFEGKIKNGYLSGLYTNLALVNSMVIGYVKIKGDYDLEKGDLKIVVFPSILFWAVSNFILIGSTILFFQGDSSDYIGAFFLVLFEIVTYIIFLIESWSFIKNIKRLIK